MDKILHNLQLHDIATFKSAGVVENVTGMGREAQLVLDVMLATLYKRILTISCYQGKYACCTSWLGPSC